MYFRAADFPELKSLSSVRRRAIIREAWKSNRYFHELMGAIGSVLAFPVTIYFVSMQGGRPIVIAVFIGGVIGLTVATIAYLGVLNKKVHPAIQERVQGTAYNKSLNTDASDAGAG
jgi:hypothetical protein